MKSGSGGSRRLRRLFWAGLLVVVAYFAASFWVGLQAKAVLEQYAMRDDWWQNLKVQILEHENGILDSTGVLAISHPAAPDGQQVRMSYRIWHALWPTRLANVSWMVEAPKIVMNRAAARPELTELHGHGVLGWGGRFQGKAIMEGRNLQKDSSHVVFSSMKLQLDLGQDYSSMSFQWPEVRMISVDGLAATPVGQVQDLEWTIEILSQKVTHAWSAARLSWAPSRITASGLVGNIQSGTGFVDGSSPFVDFDWQVRSEAVEIAGYQARQVELQGSVKNVSAQAVSEIAGYWATSFSWPELTADMDLSPAWRSLLFDGFQVQQAQMKALSDWGIVQAQADVSLLPVPQDVQEKADIQWEKYLVSSAGIDVQGVPPTLAFLGVMTGVFERTQSGIRSSCQIDQGNIVLNGHQVPELAAKPVLGLINRFLNSLVETDPEKIRMT